MPCSGPLGGAAWNPATYRRIVKVWESDGVTPVATLNDYGDPDVDDVVESLEYELLRYGGCGAGSMQVAESFDDDILETGQIVTVEFSPGDFRYRGVIESVESTDPSGTSVTMYGLISLLGHLMIGGQTGQGCDRKPHAFGTDIFQFRNDPDFTLQSWTTTVTYFQFVENVLASYTLPPSITLGTIEAPNVDTPYESAVYRGDESLSTVLRAASTALGGMSYGVNADGELFFIKPVTTCLGRWRIGENTTGLRRFSDRDLLVNKLLIVGDQTYGEGGLVWFNDLLEQAVDDVVGAFQGLKPGMGVRPYRHQRWYCDNSSVSLYGPHVRRILAPWIRTDADSEALASALLMRYSTPRTRYEWETLPTTSSLQPWEGWVSLEDESGTEIDTDTFERCVWTFDAAPVCKITLGIEDLQFVEPPERERHEIPDQDQQSSSSGATSESISDSVTLTSSDAPSSDASSDRQSSDAPSSNASSDQQSSDAPSSDAPSSGAPSSNASSDQQSSNAPSSDATSQSSDAPSSDATSQSSDAPSSDATSQSSDAPSSDAPSSDASSSRDSSDAPSSDAFSDNECPPCHIPVEVALCGGGCLTICVRLPGDDCITDDDSSSSAGGGGGGLQCGECPPDNTTLTAEVACAAETITLSPIGPGQWGGLGTAQICGADYTLSFECNAGSWTEVLTVNGLCTYVFVECQDGAGGLVFSASPDGGADPCCPDTCVVTLNVA